MIALKSVVIAAGVLISSTVLAVEVKVTVLYSQPNTTLADFGD